MGHVIFLFPTKDVWEGLYVNFLRYWAQIIEMLAGLAGYESSQIGRRVKAGMARAKAHGKWISRPPLPEHTQQLMRRAYEDHRC